MTGAGEHRGIRTGVKWLRLTPKVSQEMRPTPGRFPTYHPKRFSLSSFPELPNSCPC